MVRRRTAHRMAKRIDLRKDFAEIYAYVAEQVQSFDPLANDGPVAPGPVPRIDLGYGFEQGGTANVQRHPLGCPLTDNQGGYAAGGQFSNMSCPRAGPVLNFVKTKCTVGN